MQWEFLEALTIAMPVIVFPMWLIWYLAAVCLAAVPAGWLAREAKGWPGSEDRTIMWWLTGRR